VGGRLADKVALVSGGARGMGASHGQLMAQQGARVVLTDILDDVGQSVAAHLRRDGNDVTYLHHDVTRIDSWVGAIAQTEQLYGPVTVLVNNAGIIGSMLPAAEESEEDWAKTIAVNQTGVFFGMKTAIPSMRAVGGGSIINICSIWGLSGTAGYLSYQASKGAVQLMTKSAALSYARDGIRVNSICPGLVMTEMAIEEGDESNAALVNLTPMRRGASPAEVSHGVVYLASDESSYVTGTELVIDGGYLAQ